MSIYSDLFEYRDGKLFNRGDNNPNAKKGTRAGTLNKSGYRTVKANKKNYLEHRVIWEMHYGPIPDGLQIDHINRNKSDNKIENLRLVTQTQNQWNKKVKGWHYCKKYNKYKAKITRHGKQKHLGYFETPEEARAAYLEARSKVTNYCQ